MRIRFDSKELEDGRKRRVLMCKPHWWSSWRPVSDMFGNPIVDCGFLLAEEEEIIDKLRTNKEYGMFDEENYKTRVSMLNMVLDAEDVYVGAYDSQEGYSMAYDVPNLGSVEELQNLEIVE